MANVDPSDNTTQSSGQSILSSGRREFLARLGLTTGVLAAAPGMADAAQAELEAGMSELVSKMGDHFDPFPGQGIDGFLSHFIIMLEFLKGPAAGKIITIDMPTAVQSVSRSDPFIYAAGRGHSVTVPLPSSCTLPASISEDCFLNRPPEFFQEGRETVWMQILNLDARMDSSELGPVRIILGETLKREYPDIFLPSYGIAQSVGRARFPARLYFNPYAIIETSYGAFRAVHGTLSYGRVVAFPPIGTPVSIPECIPLESVDDVRRTGRIREIVGDPAVRIIALAHPIDVGMQIPGEEAFNAVERLIDMGGSGKQR